ncbi:hypothetical protein [Paenibacillus tyrfis]|uniref:hypothetical protein n=1 Tax=Paenibacillus tyrfis TaxID=1501230 RepID=UPI00209D1528|nr:hypothetical protein [Paenibacillus tyrfis]MCP1310417.1 hypothetical protein [Paenibacillus tyrfis]
MDKRNYYVSVQSKTIMQHQGDAAYELEIEATPEEIIKLKELFEDMEYAEEQTFPRTLVPGIPYHHDEENDVYDIYLKNVYQTLYSLGTDETKKHVQTMNVLD